MFIKWTDRELNSDPRHARAVSFPWTISPFVLSGPHGSRTHHTDLARVSRPQRHAGPSIRGPSGNRTRSPSLPRTCAAATPTDHVLSDPGWNRTSTFLDVDQASSPLDHGIMSVTSDRGGSRTHKVTRLSTSSLCLFAYPAVFKLRVRGSHPAVRAYEAPMSTGPPASCRSRYRAGRQTL